MQDFKELIKSSYRMSMIYSVLFAIIGLLLFIDPSGFVVLVSYMIGILLLVVGINNVLSYSKNRDLAVTKTLLIVGVILFIIGLFLIFDPTFIGTIVPAVIGVCLIINALEKLMYLQYLEDKKSEAYMVALISGIVIMIVGIILLFNPLSGTLIVTQIIGVIIVIYSVLDIIEKIRYKKLFKEIKKDIKIIDEK